MAAALDKDAERAAIVEALNCDSWPIASFFYANFCPQMSADGDSFLPGVLR